MIETRLTDLTFYAYLFLSLCGAERNVHFEFWSLSELRLFFLSNSSTSLAASDDVSGPKVIEENKSVKLKFLHCSARLKSMYWPSGK